MSKPISELPDFVRGMFSDAVLVLQETATRIKERMAVPGSPITYPVDWDSDKQKRAFFASNGFGGGIPYQRKNIYPTLWQASYHEFGASVFADHPAGAIGGTLDGWQSKIHKGRYPHLLTVVLEEITKLPEEISKRVSVRFTK